MEKSKSETFKHHVKILHSNIASRNVVIIKLGWLKPDTEGSP